MHMQKMDVTIGRMTWRATSKLATGHHWAPGHSFATPELVSFHLCDPDYGEGN